MGKIPVLDWLRLETCWVTSHTHRNIYRGQWAASYFHKFFCAKWTKIRICHGFKKNFCWRQSQNSCLRDSCTHRGVFPKKIRSIVHIWSLFNPQAIARFARDLAVKIAISFAHWLITKHQLDIDVIVGTFLARNIHKFNPFFRQPMVPWKMCPLPRQLFHCDIPCQCWWTLLNSPQSIGRVELLCKNNKIQLGASKNRGTPKSWNFNRVFHYKPSILGYPYFWKHLIGSTRNQLQPGSPRCGQIVMHHRTTPHITNIRLSLGVNAATQCDGRGPMFEFFHRNSSKTEIEMILKWSRWQLAVILEPVQWFSR